MAKDSYWFRHDSTAGRGLKMRKMAFIYGHWGKGIYWDVLEILRDQDNYSFDCDETSLQMLADIIGCKDAVKFVNWFNDCVKLDLLQKTDNKFFSVVLRENMGFWETKKSNGNQGGRPKKKPNQNLNETKTITETKANRNHNIIEYNITEQNKTNNTQIEWWFRDLENSEHLETIARVNKLSLDYVKSRIPEFRKKADLDYPTYSRFINHFKNFILKTKSEPIKNKTVEL